MSKDYYAILGVSRGSDEKEIKSAYRKLARRYHPDVNPGDSVAEEKFKEVSVAYDVLSDPEKRKAYDRYGENYDQVQSGGGGHIDFDIGGMGGFGSIFEQFFQHQGGVKERQRGVPPRDVEMVVQIPLEEIDTGTKRTLNYQTSDACKSCDGTGEVRLKGSSLERCPTCGGSGTQITTRKVEVKIPAGVSEGQKLRVPGGGSRGANGRNGDLYVIVREIPHERFARKGSDLNEEVEVDYLVAILGGELKVPTMTGQVMMKIPSGSQNGQKFRLSNQGLSSLKGERGSLFVRIKVQLPKELTAKQRKLLEQLKEISQ